MPAWNTRSPNAGKALEQYNKDLEKWRNVQTVLQEALKDEEPTKSVRIPK